MYSINSMSSSYGVIVGRVVHRSLRFVVLSFLHCLFTRACFLSLLRGLHALSWWAMYQEYTLQFNNKYLTAALYNSKHVNYPHAIWYYKYHTIHHNHECTRITHYNSIINTSLLHYCIILNTWNYPHAIWYKYRVWYKTQQSWYTNTECMFFVKSSMIFICNRVGRVYRNVALFLN